MLHPAGGDGDLGRRHLPLRGGRAHQTGTRGGGGHAQRLPAVGHAGRAAGGVNAEFAGEFADHPFAYFDLGGLGATFRLQRVKRQTA